MRQAPTGDFRLLWLLLRSISWSFALVKPSASAQHRAQASVYFCLEWFKWKGFPVDRDAPVFEAWDDPVGANFAILDVFLVKKRAGFDGEDGFYGCDTGNGSTDCDQVNKTVRGQGALEKWRVRGHKTHVACVEVAEIGQRS